MLEEVDLLGGKGHTARMTQQAISAACLDPGAAAQKSETGNPVTASPAQPQEPEPEQIGALGAIRASFGYGCVPYLDGSGELRIRGAAAQLPPDVRRALKTHKNEIRAILAEPVGQWPLGVFMSSPAAVLVWSEVLGEMVILAGERADVEAFKQQRNILARFVVYRGRELLTALNGGRLQLQVIHEFKRDGGAAPVVIGEVSVDADGVILEPP